jgi:hypothetical protein
LVGFRQKAATEKQLTNDFGGLTITAYATGRAVPGIGVGYDVISLGNYPDCYLRSILCGDFAQNRLQMNFDDRFGNVKGASDQLVRVTFSQTR